MQTIFIQVKTELGQAYKVAEEAVEAVSQVSEIHSTSGQFDLLIKCYLDRPLLLLFVDCLLQNIVQKLSDVILQFFFRVFI